MLESSTPPLDRAGSLKSQAFTKVLRNHSKAYMKPLGPYGTQCPGYKCGLVGSFTPQNKLHIHPRKEAGMCIDHMQLGLKIKSSQSKRQSSCMPPHIPCLNSAKHVHLVLACPYRGGTLDYANWMKAKATETNKTTSAKELRIPGDTPKHEDPG